TLRYEVCNAQTCMPPTNVELPVSFTVQPGAARPEFIKAAGVSPNPPGSATQGPSDDVSKEIRAAQEAGLLPFMLVAFLAGLASLLTPCVFPMIPITVSYFSKQKGDNDKLSFGGPIAYCLGIIGTFTFLGVLVGSTGLDKIATNWYVNAILAALFIFLAASLFGVFELRLPGWLVNKAAAGSRSGGLAGAVLMGLTFTMTSFTCTVPFVGTLLGTSAQQGLKYSILGMLSYSTAFALPFFLLALFPSFLTKLPRSGAWLVTVKAFMGFLELMAALKFLSNVDLHFRFEALTRNVFLAVWAATAAVGALYLLGWLRLPHDSDTKVGWIRRGFGAAMAVLAFFCLAGMNGTRLGEFAAFLPPDPYPGHGNKEWIDSYEEALARAKETHQNIFIDFTGVYCTNCRDIEENVFPKPAVHDLLQKFVRAKLFTDDGSPEDNANQKLQVQMSGVTSLPLYAVVSPDGKVLKIHQQQAPIEDADQFLSAIRPFTGAVVASR
ncbi:MAG TPA: cytochrome c biogenesis protein CcdA, partial [Fimbriimonadaceae bacterium]|nr:cytochrome c biogenesis protein CcdA [Fimbriimonadaceae bacterium]